MLNVLLDFQNKLNICFISCMYVSTKSKCRIIRKCPNHGKTGKLVWFAEVQFDTFVDHTYFRKQFQLLIAYTSIPFQNKKLKNFAKRIIVSSSSKLKFYYI